jgi:hypothetical protein
MAIDSSTALSSDRFGSTHSQVGARCRLYEQKNFGRCCPEDASHSVKRSSMQPVSWLNPPAGREQVKQLRDFIGWMVSSQ